MKATLGGLVRLARSADTQRMLQELAFVYADITNVPVEALRWDDVVLDRTNARWRELLALARLLVERRYQTTSFGGASGFSLLFEMNILFEKYIARMLARALHPEGFSVKAQGGVLHCLEEVRTGTRRFHTKPDIRVRRDGEMMMVLDTKWKRLARHADDPKRGMSQGDVYQMIAYGRLYGAPRLVLLYPHHGKLDAPEGVVERYRVTGSREELIAATVDVSRSDDLVPRLRQLAREIESTAAAAA
jgi:5-methylcytosine-specific restriction enzyme subunit McrC